MTKDDFQRLVETYGANDSRWPEEHRHAMINWQAENAAEAQAVLASEQELDMALDSARLEPGTDMLKARILSQLPKEETPALPQAANSNVRRFGQKAVAALMLCAFTAGFAGASFLKVPVGAETDTQTLVVESEWEELAEDYGFDDVYEWVEASPAP